MKAAAAKTALRWGLAAAAVIMLQLVVPVPYVIYEPGMTVPVSGRVVIGAEGHEGQAGQGQEEREGDEGQAGQDPLSTPDPKQGEFLLTTVYLKPRATLWEVLTAARRKDREVHAKRAVFQGNSIETYAERMNVLMAESQSKAVEAAFRAAGVRYDAVPDGLYVSQGAGLLEAGDRIQAADGSRIDGKAALAEALRGRAGGSVELTVLRGGRKTVVRLDVDAAAVDALPDKLGGAELTEVLAIRPDDPALDVTIDAGNFAGPSAGLPLALHIYERLTGDALTGGRSIAATGTIEPSGGIGAVGGIAMKAIAASRAGADLFLVPAANAAEAAAAADAAGGGMAVAGVETLEEAVSLLRASRGQDGRTISGGS
jgi:PDZ domain-containing protein